MDLEYIDFKGIVKKYTKYTNFSNKELECGKKIFKKLELDEEENVKLVIECTSTELAYFIVDILRTP